MRLTVIILLSGAMVLIFHTSCSRINTSGDDSPFGNDVLAGPEITERPPALHQLSKSDTALAQVRLKGKPAAQEQKARSTSVNSSFKNPSGNDEKIPAKHEAQDFNTTRSNRQDSNYQMGLTGGNNQGVADSSTAPTPARAQDFNTTRSNRQNSNYQLGLTGRKNKGGVDSSTAPTPARAQDFNTTRSNRQNSNYQMGLTGGNNKGGVDSTAAPTPAQAQDIHTAHNNTGKNPFNSFSINVGLVSRSDGHTGRGWLISGYHETPLGSIRNLRLTVGVTYTSQAFQYQVPKKLPREFAGELAESIGQGRWNILTVSAGPAFEFGKSRFHADLYARPGISFVAIADQFVGITETPEKIDDEHGIAKFSGNKTPLSLQTGIHIGYAINGKIDLFLNPNFFATISRNISYLEKDVSKALRDGKNFDYSTFISLPYERKIERIQVAAISAGIKINFYR